MMQTYEAVLQPNGQLQFLDLATTALRTPQRVLVTFTQAVVQEAAPPTAVPVDSAVCGAVLSEAALAQDWLRDEEDAAWGHLQAAR